jgi:hypothetical protein
MGLFRPVAGQLYLLQAHSFTRRPYQGVLYFRNTTWFHCNFIHAHKKALFSRNPQVPSNNKCISFTSLHPNRTTNVSSKDRRSLYAARKSVTLTAQLFTKLTNAQQIFMGVSRTDFCPNRATNVKIKATSLSRT